MHRSNLSDGYNPSNYEFSFIYFIIFFCIVFPYSNNAFISNFFW